MRVYYNPKLKGLARQLRKNSTLSEVLLWKFLKGKEMKGYDFHRQKPIEDYIVDFYCPRLKLIIEIDGQSHEWKGGLDEFRQRKLELSGFHILRFDDMEIKRNLDLVLTSIENWIREHENTM